MDEREILRQAVTRLGEAMVRESVTTLDRAFQSGHGALINGNLEDAKNFFMEALDICHTLGLPAYKPLVKLGQVYLMQSYTSKSLNLFQQALDIIQDLDVSPFNAPIYIDIFQGIGEVYWSEGSWEVALQYFKAALKFIQDLRPREIKELDKNHCLINILGRIGDVHFGKEEDEEALKYFEKALAEARQLSDFLGIINNLFRIGDVYCRQKKDELAFQAFQKALKLAQNKRYSIGVIKSLSGIGDVYLGGGKNEKSLKYFEEALAEAQKLSAPVYIISNLTHIGDLYLKQEENQKALDMYSKALDILRNTDPSQMIDMSARLHHFLTLSSIYQKAMRSVIALAKSLETYNSTDTSANYLTAITLLEESRSMMGSFELRKCLCKPIDPFKEAALVIEGFSDTKHWFLLQSAHAANPFQLPTNVTKTQGGLVDLQIQSVPMAIEDEFRHLQQNEEEKFKNISLTGRFTNKDLALALDAETVAIGYFVDQDDIYRYSLDLVDGEVRLLKPPHKLASTYGEVKTVIKELSQSIESYGKERASPQPKSYRLLEFSCIQMECLTNLYTQLAIKETLQEIGEKHNLDNTSLLICPEMLFHNIPFAALNDGATYLYEKVRDIHTTISLRILGLQRRFPLAKELRCTFFGVPGIAHYDAKENISKIECYLPSVIEEAEKLKNILGKDKVVYFGYGGLPEYMATSSAMRKHHGAGTLFYFSGHGYSNNSGYPRSGPVLLDGVLSYTRLMTEENQWNFGHQITVVLSSCFLGNQISLEREMFGMITALFTKGSSSVISALWGVDDEACSQFMPELVGHLRDNLLAETPHPRARAMKSAIDFLRQLDNNRYDVPYFFAPFFICGAP